jgi:hypothetical protein
MTQERSGRGMGSDAAEFGFRPSLWRPERRCGAAPKQADTGLDPCRRPQPPVRLGLGIIREARINPDELAVCQAARRRGSLAVRVCPMVQMLHTGSVADRVRTLLDVYQKVNADNPGLPRGTLVIEQGFLADTTQHARALRLGVAVTVQHHVALPARRRPAGRGAGAARRANSTAPRWCRSGGCWRGVGELDIPEREPRLQVEGPTVRL